MAKLTISNLIMWVFRILIVFLPFIIFWVQHRRYICVVYKKTCMCLTLMRTTWYIFEVCVLASPGSIVAVEGNWGSGKWKGKSTCEGDEANGKKHLCLKRLKDCPLVVILLLHLFVCSPSSFVALKGTGHVIFSVLLGDIFLHQVQTTFSPTYKELPSSSLLRAFPSSFLHTIIPCLFICLLNKQKLPTNGIFMDSEAEQIVWTSPGFVWQGNPWQMAECCQCGWKISRRCQKALWDPQRRCQTHWTWPSPVSSLQNQHQQQLRHW